MPKDKKGRRPTPKATRHDVARTVAVIADALILMDVSFNALDKAEKDRMDKHKSVADHPGPYMMQRLAGLIDGVDDTGRSVRKYLPAMLSVAKSTAEAYAAIAPEGSEFARNAAAAAAHADHGLATFPARDDDPYMIYEFDTPDLEEDDENIELADLFKEKWDIGRTFDGLMEEMKRLAHL